MTKEQIEDRIRAALLLILAEAGVPNDVDLFYGDEEDLLEALDTITNIIVKHKTL